MATAREVRAAVRAQLAEQMASRQKAALSVASAYSKVEKARERLAAAEQEACTAIATATETLPLTELVALAGVPAPELRRLTRGSKQEAPDGTAHPGGETAPDPASGDGAPFGGTPEPVAAG